MKQFGGRGVRLLSLVMVEEAAEGTEVYPLHTDQPWPKYTILPLAFGLKRIHHTSNKVSRRFNDLFIGPRIETNRCNKARHLSIRPNGALIPMSDMAKERLPSMLAFQINALCRLHRRFSDNGHMLQMVMRTMGVDLFKFMR